jgi:hypothetical protein
MRRLLLPAALLSLLTVTAAALTLGFGDRLAAGQVSSRAKQLTVNPGDTIRVNGADVGCQVTERGGRPTIECRRVTSPKHSYGTFISERRAIVARYNSGAEAREVFRARHGGGWRACRATPRASRAFGSGCR